IVGLLLMRRRGKKRAAAAAMGTSVPPPARAPSPTPSYSPSPTPASPSPSYTPTPQHQMQQAVTAGDGKTVDLPRTIAITPDGDTATVNFGHIKFLTGVLSGQRFDVKPEGAYLGRDSSSAQIVIADPRISKRHLWLGVRDGMVTVKDEGSRNGTFVN